MLGRIRKFSSSIFAKIFLVLIAIPFIFWGMGDLFSGGTQKTIAKIGEEKISTNEFIEYINLNSGTEKDLNSNIIQKMLSDFIGEKIIEKEIKDLNIIISDFSLSKIIKNENIFKKENKFSRTEYEKFLIINSLDAVTFEKNILKIKKKELLAEFISGGIVPSNFLVNLDFDSINQKREIEIINLKDIINKVVNFSSSEIQLYFENNKNNYSYLFKTIRYLEINPENLTGSNEFTDLFFEKIDKIDDLIIEQNKLDIVLKKFNLNTPTTITFDKLGKTKNGNDIKNLPDELIKNIFLINESDSTVLVALKNKYFIFEIIKIENIQKTVKDEFVKLDIINNLKNINKRKFISELISKINKGNFKKSDFDQFAKDNGEIIEKIIINGQNNNKDLPNELILQIYSYPERKVMVAVDLNFIESYLIFVKKIVHVNIPEKSEDYKKYFDISKVKLATNIYNTYDKFLRNKYKVDINYKALENVKNLTK